MSALSERAPTCAAEGISPPRYLTLDEIMSGKLTLDELMDAPWSDDGRTMRQWFSGPRWDD